MNAHARRYVASCGAAALVLLLMIGCNPVAPKGALTPLPSASASGAALPPLRITGHGSAQKPVRFVQSSSRNRKQYEILARSYVSVGARGHGRATFEHAQVTFFGRNGSKVVATAPHAIADEAANTVTLLGGVHAVTGNGMTLTCQRLIYSRATEMLHGNGNVVATDAHGFHATGSSFDTNIALSQLRMQ